MDEEVHLSKKGHESIKVLNLHINSVAMKIKVPRKREGVAKDR